MNVRELKYILLGDDRMSRTLRDIDFASRNTANNLSKVRGGFQDAANEVPGLGRAMDLVSNPYVLGGAAIAGVGLIASKAIDTVKEFDYEFRKLENLNLDKSKAQIDDLRNRVKDLSSEYLFDPTKASKAFFDVQSLTGDSSSNVDKLIAKVGNFSKYVQADFNESITGTAKAMANYGFGQREVDKYLESNYKTVQTALVTYDELAKVQSVFAGSAASAGQSFDSANKAFALFTVKTKSADEAATLTKSLFTDLFKAETIKSFGKAGIDVFDKQTGKLRQIDKIMLDLNRKFQDTKSEKQMIALKNTFTGSEGIMSMLSAAMDKSGQLQKTFDQFDGSKLNFGKLKENAEKDINFIEEQLNNKLKNSLLELGESLKSSWIGIKSIINDSIIGATFLVEQFKTANAFIKNDIASQTEGTVDKAAKNLKKGYNDELERWQFIFDRKYSQEEFEKRKKLIEDLIVKYQSVSENVDSPFGLEKASNFAGKADAMKKLLSDFNAFYTKGGEFTASNGKSKLPTALTNSETDTTIQKGIDSINSGGSIRNITVIVHKFTEEVNIHSQTLPEGTAEAMNILEEEFIRVIQGAEQAA